MKRILLKTIFLFVPGLIWGSCSTGNDTTTEAELVVQQVSAYTLPATGGEVEITCRSTQPVTAGSGQTWLALTDESRQGDATTFTFTAEANGTQKSRDAVVTLMSGSRTLTVTITQQRSYTQPSIPANSATQLAERLALGWNLGNQLDAHNNGVANETAWGNMAATQLLFNQIKRMGFKSVRIPVTWLGKTGEAPEYKLDQAWLDRVEQMVGYAQKSGLNVIINIHHDGYGSQYWLDIKRAATDPDYNAEVKTRLGAIWTQIAECFRETDDFLIFELMNEIQDGGWGSGANLTDGGKQYEVLNEWNQAAVDAVRATGGKNATRYLAVAGYSANPELTMAHLKLPEDSATGRLLVSVHSYDPAEFALNAQYTEWGHTADPSKKAPWGDEDFIREMCSKLYEKYVSKNIPVYFGEFGCVHRAQARAESFRKYYLEYFCRAARTYGIAAFYWDNGNAGTGKECFGLVNHSSGAFLNNGEEIVDTMVKGYCTDDESYTLETVYDNAPE